MGMKRVLSNFQTFIINGVEFEFMPDSETELSIEGSEAGLNGAIVKLSLPLPGLAAALRGFVEKQEKRVRKMKGPKR